MTDVRVLVVDDQELFRQTMSAVVDETDGFVGVGTAASGEDSVATAATLAPDLVLMDVNLPGMDGIDATRLIRGGAGRRPVVVLLSTYAEDEVDYDDCGAAGYVPKGAFGPERLLQEWAAATSG